MKANTNNEFLAWYEPIHGAFIRYCSTVSYGIVETEDLAQEAILATLQQFSKVEDKSKLLGYMIGIVRNLVRNQRRRMKFRGSWEDNLLEKLESTAPSPEVALDIHFLLKKLDELPNQQKEAILLFEVSGFSMKEISELQNSSVSATKTRISRGRKLLKTMLTEDTSKTSLSQRLAVFSTILF